MGSAERKEDDKGEKTGGHEDDASPGKEGKVKTSLALDTSLATAKLELPSPKSSHKGENLKNETIVVKFISFSKKKSSFFLSNSFLLSLIMIIACSFSFIFIISITYKKLILL